ncbi:hypothetical protein O181_040520 [Austropuccinia psidii MF-1]|uniref:Reverse transcriptase Ty1/copia-type domain-containing protein n=1 Tax=Austropuccinia psidii MF-1 TaxID=1389203 RepID=A0A9Q3DDB3_9BASI|nr:hypothetical protein [Austropuccinia psidii MF-1]
MSCKAVSTPQVASSRLLPLTSTGSEPAKIHYRRAFGLLNYLVACTRPDLAYSASCLSQFLSLPSYEHELAFKHVLHYLKGTSTWGLWLGRRNDSSSIIAYWDSDWGSNYDSTSFSGSCVILYGLVGWKTTKQDVVVLSSTEAEYHSISSCCQDVCWLLELVPILDSLLKLVCSVATRELSLFSKILSISIELDTSSCVCTGVGNYWKKALLTLNTSPCLLCLLTY